MMMQVIGTLCTDMGSPDLMHSSTNDSAVLLRSLRYSLSDFIVNLSYNSLQL